MWRDLFVVEIPVLEKVLRTIAVYLVLAVLFRFAGKRGLANLNTFDFVVMFLLSNVVQNAVIGADNSLAGGVIGAVTLVAVNAVLTRWIMRNDRARRLFEGTGSTVIEDGRAQVPVLRRLGIRQAELDHAIRIQNGDDIEQVALGRLEPSGHLVVTLKHEEQNATKGDVERLTAQLADLQRRLADLAAR
jgi:uncharacterized membrane protein YcaP (DUF421 family)